MIVFFIVIIGIIILVGLYFSKAAVVKRKLKKAKLKPVSECKNGEIVKVVGQIIYVENPLIAPLSGRECSHYYVHVEERVSSGKSSSWKTRIEEEISGKVVINDNKVLALINTDHIKSHIVQDAQFKSGTWNDATRELEAYLNRHNLESEGFLGFNKTLRYREGVLEQGEQVAVLGKCEWKKPAEVGLPDALDKILVISGSPEQNLYISDDPKTL